jgi:hypothetical protein
MGANKSFDRVFAQNTSTAAAQDCAIMFAFDILASNKLIP